ncbi:hypothetical protein Tco_0650413 [Tanacetum coccineum]
MNQLNISLNNHPLTNNLLHLRQEATTSQLMTRIDNLEKQLKETKQTFGKAILTLVERVKTLEVALKRNTKRVLLSDSEEEETEAQGRNFHDLDPGFLFAALLTNVTKDQAVDKGKRYKRRKVSKESAGTGLDFEEVKCAFEEVNTDSIKVSTGIKEINAGSLDVNTGSDPVTTDSIRVSVPSPDKGRRIGKAFMTKEEETQASKKTKEQILQEEAGLAEAIRWAEEQDISTEEQKKRKAQESVLGKDLSVEDYAKRMVELNQGDWKLTQLKKLNFEEMKAEFEKLIKQLDTYFDDETTQPTEEKVEEDKDDKPTKKTGKRRKQIARKGLHTDLDKDDSEDSDEANKVLYQIVKENGTDKVYISFGAMLTDISRDDLTELYRIVMRKHGMDKLEDKLEKVLWEYLKNMFEEPLSTDSIRSLPGLQRIICWRYYKACRVHCLNLESVDIYMLIERKYPLSTEVCKAMLNKKLQGGKPDEDCYKLLKMMEKQAGIRK